jgi:hypothetical protein
VTEKPSPFLHVKALGETKEHTYNDETKGFYVPFVINKAFAQHADTILYAQEMNCASSDLPTNMQYDFYHAMVPRRKRYGWAKKDKAVETVAVAKFLKVSLKKAAQMKKIYNEKQIAEIIDIVEQSEV